MLEVSSRDANEKIRPVSHTQLGLWLLDRLEPGTAAYNIGHVIRMRGSLSHHTLRESLAGVVARHESLRTTFVQADGEPVQIIAGSRSVELPVKDLSRIPEAEREAEVLRLARAEAHRPFDLAQGPLMRAVLLALGKDDHVLLLFMHHIVTDAWSMSVLFDEIGKLYEATVTGHPSPLPALPLQYGDVAARQRESLTQAAVDQQVAYWRAQFAGADPVLDLPADRPRPSVRTMDGAIERRMFSSALRDRLVTVSRAANASLFMTLLAAFQTMMSRYTGRDDILVGTATAGRGEVELEPLIGFFANTLVMRIDLSGDPTFHELVGRVREVALDAFAHQHVPFERLITELQVARSLSHTPLFQVMFILQNAPRQRLQLPGLTMEAIEFDPGTAKFDLTIDMAELDDGLECAFEYSTDLFEPPTITRMLRHFETLLEGVAADPGQRLSHLPLLAATERHRLLVEWNDTAADYPREACIHRLFVAQATRTPDALALVYREQRTSYRELNIRASQLAHHLRARGVGQGDLVAICLERSIEAVMGLLGILKAGAAYVPLDPAYPPARLAFMLHDSGAPVVLTARHLRDRLPAGVEIIELDTDWPQIGLEPTIEPQGGTGPLDPAYVIYTSGSTGTPKGVLATHRAAVNRFAWMWNRWKFAADEVCCQKTTLSFVDAVWEIFGPLLQGVPNVIIPEDVLLEPSRLVDLLATHQVSRIVLVPSLLRALLESVPDLGRRAPKLKFWITSGETITRELARRFGEIVPEATLVNLYGSSEVAADVSAYVITGAALPGRIPIGRPIANTRLYVLDPHTQPAPIGVPGEIYVGGDGLARGYLHDPDLTSRKFIHDPFGAEAGSRLYRTGDLGRFLADGNLEFLGRVDDQVKIRGARLELSEIEAVLREHPSVHAAVAAVAGAEGDERLVGYVVPEGRLDSSDLRQFARERLPDNMVPASFVFVDAIPLTPNGKVDRRALRAQAPLRPSAVRDYVAPRNAAEQTLAAIMAEVLKVERVGVHDDFFELGGHSLAAVQVIARVRRAFHVELPVRSLFTEPTVAGLCPEIVRAQRTGAPVMSAPGRTLSRRAELLARLSALSDAEMEALLGRLGTEASEERETETFE
jgi:amino acid adenylation domain-containing protein